MATLIFWVLWLTVTAYLYQQWQRYEPTRLAIDGLAAAAALPFAFVVFVALI